MKKNRILGKNLDFPLYFSINDDGCRCIAIFCLKMYLADFSLIKKEREVQRENDEKGTGL